MNLEVKEIEIRDLRPNNGQVDGLPKNPRKISKKQLEKLKKSLEDAPEMLRLRELICVEHPDGPVVIAGNQRLEAAKALGWETLPCKVLPADTDPAKLREYAIKDNLPFGEDDWEVIASDWDQSELEEWGMEVPDKWKSDTTAEEDDFDPDSVKETVCKKGDIWQLGRHRLMCGDSADANDVAVLMDGAKADMVFTDPPYGVDVVGSGGNIGGDTKFAKAGSYKKVIGDDKDFDPTFILTTFDKSKIMLWGANYFANRLPNSGKWLVWDKNRCEGTTFSDCELCWTNLDGIVVKKYKCTWDGMRREGESGQRVHPTQKPIKLCGDIIQDYSKDGDIIVDIFGGSGTTLIAAEQLGRKCYMMELDPHYCDVIIARWEKLTGKKATKIN